MTTERERPDIDTVREEMDRLDDTSERERPSAPEPDNDDDDDDEERDGE